MCEAPGHTKEHIPPLCFFPSTTSGEFRKNLFTVKSCIEHNSSKSKDDEYAFCVMAMTIPDGSPFESFAVRKLTRLYKDKPGIRRLIKLEPERWMKLGGVYQYRGMTKVDTPRLAQFFRQMAYGLYFKHYQKRWTGRVQLHFGFLRYSENRPAIKNYLLDERDAVLKIQFAEATSHGANQPVFNYQVREFDDGAVTIRMRFYGNVSVWAILPPIPSTC